VSHASKKLKSSGINGRGMGASGSMMILRERNVKPGSRMARRRRRATPARTLSRRANGPDAQRGQRKASATVMVVRPHSINGREAVCWEVGGRSISIAMRKMGEHGPGICRDNSPISGLCELAIPASRTKLRWSM